MGAGEVRRPHRKPMILPVLVKNRSHGPFSLYPEGKDRLSPGAKRFNLRPLTWRTQNMLDYSHNRIRAALGVVMRL
jgi:hypothetical protein